MSAPIDDAACITRQIPGRQPLKVPEMVLPFPFTAEQLTAVVATAHAFGVEPWEMALHVLNFREFAEGRAKNMPAKPRLSPSEKGDQ